MGAALLRIGKMQSKWRVKLAKALESPIKTGNKGWFKQFVERYAMFVLPFVTVLREGIEAVVFVAGVSFSASAKSIPLPTVVGLFAGCCVGYLLYKGGASTKLQFFLVLSTCLLYLVGAGLFSRSVWSFEMAKWNEYIGGEADEFGNGPGSYDIDQSVWHVNCCTSTDKIQNGWGIFNAILGWTNSATYGSVISYNLYWICVMTGFIIMRFKETPGRYPFGKAKAPANAVDDAESHATSSPRNVSSEKTTTA
ncbi:hypothetical protein NXS19_008746 [Fusarium pseudograminearum]|nr:hypothetical protein NXS19_008746 [Fusarium pseudograminearum]